MQSSSGRYFTLAKRWAWLVVLAMIIGGGIGYGVSKTMTPMYKASALIGVNLQDSPTHIQDTTNSLQTVPTYAQLVTTSVVLDPVVASHQNMTLEQLRSIITAQPIANTQLIELDVTTSNPAMGAELANEIAWNFAHYVSRIKLSATIQLISSEVPDKPISPKPLQDAGIGLAGGLVLALIFISLFESLAKGRRLAKQVQSNSDQSDSVTEPTDQSDSVTEPTEHRIPIAPAQ